MPFLRAELQLQFLKEHWMVETSAIVRAIQQPVTSQDFDSLGLTFMNSEPLVNGLKCRERLAGWTLIGLPLCALLLPSLQE